MTWPADNNPAESSFKDITADTTSPYKGLADKVVWFECNGQSFNSSEYPKLYQILGKNNVPDYRGLFLRGWSHQVVADDKTRLQGEFIGNIHERDIKIKMVSSVDHKAGNFGEIQYDTSRPIVGGLGHMQFAEPYGPNFNEEDIQNTPNVFSFFQVKAGNDGEAPYAGSASFPVIGSQYNTRVANFQEFKNKIVTGKVTDFKDDPSGWYNALTKYSYNFNWTTDTTEDGKVFISNLEVNEVEIHPELTAFFNHSDMLFDISRQVPTSDEFRPVNTAVKFFICAK